MFDYKQFGLVSSFFSEYKDFISDVKCPERGERLLIHSSEMETARRLRSEQNHSSLL